MIRLMTRGLALRTNVDLSGIDQDESTSKTLRFNVKVLDKRANYYCYYYYHSQKAEQEPAINRCSLMVKKNPKGILRLGQL
jgi:hypothetical protein